MAELDVIVRRRHEFYRVVCQGDDVAIRVTQSIASDIEHDALRYATPEKTGRDCDTMHAAHVATLRVLRVPCPQCGDTGKRTRKRTDTAYALCPYA